MQLTKLAGPGILAPVIVHPIGEVRLLLNFIEQDTAPMACTVPAGTYTVSPAAAVMVQQRFEGAVGDGSGRRLLAKWAARTRRSGTRRDLGIARTYHASVLPWKPVAASTR
jgi:hypothetical protein